VKVFGNLATWYFWAYYAAGLLIMASVMVLHLRHVRMSTRGPWLIVLGGYLGAIGAFVGGLQAGGYPPLPADVGVAVIRLFWVAAVAAGVIAACIYLWSLRGKR
jgi:hypothetical protein